MGTAVRDIISSQVQQLGTVVSINPIHFIITRRVVGNSGKNKPNTLLFIITRGALGNSSKRHYCISSQEEQLETTIRINPIYYIITR